MNRVKVTVLDRNCVEVIVDGSHFLQSYDSVVVARMWGDKSDGKTYLDPLWDCTKATTRHVSSWLDLTPQEIRQWILDGSYTVEDLN